jgi:hypothetical protein
MMFYILAGLATILTIITLARYAGSLDPRYPTDHLDNFWD